MVKDAECVIAWTTLPADGDAVAFARTLVEEHLAACVSTYPHVESVYRWRGKMEQACEQVLLIKTTIARLERLRERVCQLHPDEVPEFLVVPVIAGNASYLNWIIGSTTS